VIKTEELYVIPTVLFTSI